MAKKVLPETRKARKTLMSGAAAETPPRSDSGATPVSSKQPAMRGASGKAASQKAKAATKKRTKQTQGQTKAADKKSAQGGGATAEQKTKRGRPRSADKYKEIATDIEAKIESGELPPGTVLEPQIVLADRYHVSRQTIAKAIAELQAHGFVHAQTSRGTVVTSSTILYHIDQSLSFDNNIQRANRKPSSELLSSKIDRAPTEIAARLGIPQLHDAIKLEFVRGANGAPIAWSLSWLPEKRFTRIPDIVGRGFSLLEAFSRLGLRRVERQWAEVSSRMATAKEKRMLDLKATSVVFIINSAYADEGGEIICVTRSIMPAGTVTLVLNSQTSEDLPGTPTSNG